MSPAANGTQGKAKVGRTETNWASVANCLSSFPTFAKTHSTDWMGCATALKTGSIAAHRGEAVAVPDLLFQDNFNLSCNTLKTRKMCFVASE
jgi:hypothetical protein